MREIESSLTWRNGQSEMADDKLELFNMIMSINTLHKSATLF